MKIIFIAAGSSTRLGKYTESIPKGLLKIHDKSIIQTQLDLFNENKIKDVIIVTGPNKEKFNFENVSYIYDINYKDHEVLGSLMSARVHFDDELITTYSDIVFDEKIAQSIIQFSGEIGIAVDLNWESNYEGRDQHPKSQADNVLIKNEKIIQIQKNISKCEKNEKIGEFIGLMKLSKNAAKLFSDKFLELEKNHIGKFHNANSFKKAYLTDMLQELINSGMSVTPIYVGNQWCEIDTPQDLEKARKLFSN
tara:strand:+ start:1115 stop:1867 length:753 start_codon:yes stop_codon:yes gene_type:complete